MSKIGDKRHDEYITRFEEGVRLGAQREKDRTRQREFKMFLLGVALGVGISVLVYIEIVSTYIAD